MRFRAGGGPVVLVFVLVILGRASPARGQLEVIPFSIDFDNVRVGSQEVDAIALGNAGAQRIQDVTCSITAGTDDYSIENTCPTTIDAGAITEIIVRFTPTARGIRNGNLRVQGTRNDADFIRDVPLSGNGIAPQMVVTVLPDAPTALDFGSARVGAASRTTFTLRVDNDGDDVLSARLVEGGLHQGDWAYTPSSTSFLVPAEDSRIITATFTPGDIGNRVAMVTITDASGLSSTPTRFFNLAGLGSDPVATSLSTTKIDFGAVDVQVTDPVRRTVTVSNPGTQRLFLTDIRLETADGQTYPGTEYELIGKTTRAVLPGDTQDIELSYRPTVESEGDSAVLVMATNVVATPRISVELSGRGIDRHIQVTPESIDFGTIYRSPTEPPQVVLQVENTGESPLRLSAPAREGTNAGAFDLIGDLDREIPPSGSSSVTVQFSPSTGTDIGELFEESLVLLNDDDERPRVRVDLRGTAVLPAIAPTRTEIDLGQVAVGEEASLSGDAGISLRNESREDTFVLTEVRAVGIDGEPLEAVQVELAGSIAIPPQAQRRLRVTFAPDHRGIVAGAIEVLVDADPVPVVRIPITGMGTTEAKIGCSAAGSGTSNAVWLLGPLLLLLWRRQPRHRGRRPSRAGEGRPLRPERVRELARPAGPLHG